MINRLALLLFLTILLSVPGLWSASAPLDEEMKWFQYTLQFSQLDNADLTAYLAPFTGPKQFRLSTHNAPWATNYFPMSSGGIAHRWRIGEYPPWIHTRDTIAKLTPKQRRNLSPIEKYDLWMADYDFLATRHELLIRGPWRDPFPDDWEGFCNGARCAGLLTPEPQTAVVVQNADGIDIQFSPADIKALASASYFYTEKYAQLGGPSSHGYGEQQPNPAIFDLALRYLLAHHRRGFVIDTHLGAEIWNETVVGYQRRLGDLETLETREQILYPLATHKIKVDVILETLGEIPIKESNHSTQFKVADGSLLTPLETSYTLYLDEQQRALGGEWDNRNLIRGVDFAWFGGGRGSDHENERLGGNPYLKFDKVLELLHKATPQIYCARLFSPGSIASP